MSQEIDLGGTIYISSKRAAEITGYAQDYIGQLARSGQIEAKRISGLWYVLEDSLRNHKKKADEFKPEPPVRRSAPEMEAAVSFDGRDFISAQRAAKITGYHQDYVTQLARSGKIVSRQIGNRWYVDRETLVEHKRHNDSLLAAVQADAVGIQRPEVDELQPAPDTNLYFKYEASGAPEVESPIPTIPEKEASLESVEAPVRDAEQPINHGQSAQSGEMVSEESRTIPIRVIPKPIVRSTQPKAGSEISNTRYDETTYKSKGLLKAVIFSMVLIVSSGLIYAGLVLARVPLPIPTNVAGRARQAEDQGTGVLYQVRGVLSKELIYIRE